MDENLKDVDQTITGSDVIVDRLLAEGVRAVFLVPGAQVDPLCMRLIQKPAPTPIIATHELAAGFMADGYFRASGAPGVCMGIGACGVANMVPAASVAFADGSAILFLTGNTPVDLKGYHAFQDGWEGGSDDLRLMQQFVSYSAAPVSEVELCHGLDQAFLSLQPPYFTPVHLSLPFDLQKRPMAGGFNAVPTLSGSDEGPEDSRQLREAITKSLAQASRPCLLVGPRFNGLSAEELLRTFVETYQIPIATTLSAKGVLPEDHPLSLGNFGFSGSRRAEEVLLEEGVDLLLVLGADFNERDSVCWNEQLRSGGRKVVRVDLKPVQSLGFQADIDYRADCVQLLRDWLDADKASLKPLLKSGVKREQWVKSLADIPSCYPLAERPCDDPSVVGLDSLVLSLRDAMPRETNLVVDAGLQRVFAGHYWAASRSGSFFSACGTAPLGWAVCAAAGVQIARPDEPVVVLTGDGCMGAHGTELATLVRYRLPIVIILCNNGVYGSVHRRLQEDELTKLPSVDWLAFARSLGAEAIRFEVGVNDTGVNDTLTTFFKDALALAQNNQSPVVVDIKTPAAPELPSKGISRAALSSFT